MSEEVWELPPAEHPIGVYVGLILSSFILGVGSIVLFISIYSIFKTDGLNFTTNFVGRTLFFFASAYGGVASVSALYNIVGDKRAQTKKVEKEFKHFTVYARPLVEEVIRQRLVGQKVADQLEHLKKTDTFSGGYGGTSSTTNAPSRWNETLIMIAIMANVSVGLYLYLDRYPWEMVPYSLIFLAIGWWLIIARHFDFVNDSRSYYVPAVYVLLVPSLSIILRAYLQLHQVLFLTFFSLIPYVFGMYAYYSYLVFGKLPSYVPNRFSQGLDASEPLEEVKNGGNGNGNGNGNSKKIQEFMPPKNNGD